MKLAALRGATTVKYDEAELIKVETLILFDKLVELNRLKQKNIVCVIIGSTLDIKSYYPATALRLSKKCDAPLYSTLEPDIDNNLPLCIRMLLLAKCKNPKHVYLNNAKNLINNN